MKSKRVFALVASLFVINFTALPSVSEPLQETYPSITLCTTDDAITGTLGDDTLIGTNGDDVICGSAGNDTIDGGGGNDIIFGGDGNDVLTGGDGDDQLVGQVGDDVLGGNSGTDAIWGDEGQDELSGDTGEDFISGGPGADNLFGGRGADTLLAGKGDDGLRGGEDADWLDGEGGNDTCARESGDTVKKCFYDSRGPFISQIAVDPETASIDTSLIEKTVHIKFVLNDPGSGAQQATLWFEPKATRKQGQGAEFLEFRLDTSVVCADLKLYSPNQVPRNCRLSGNESRGIYTASVKVPSNSRKGLWVFSGAQMSDKALNQTEWTFKNVDSRKLAVSFNQTGTPDRSAPAIRNLQVIGSNVFESQDTVLKMSVEFSDPHGLGLVSIHYKRFVDVTYSGNSNLTACADEVVFTRACLRSGTPTDGVIEFPVRLTAVVYPAVYLVPEEIEFHDKLGNARHSEIKLNSSKRALTLVKSFVTPKPVDDLDVKSPVISKMSLSKKQIDTQGGEAKFKITVQVKDSGIGLNFVDPNINFNFYVEGEQIPTDFPVELVANSGNGNSGSYVFEVTVPAHFRQGNIMIAAARAQDASQRENYCEYGVTAFKARGWSYIVKNG